MEFYHRQVLRLACLVTGDKELRQFTLHKALLQFLGYDWWDGPGRGLGYVLKRVVHPTLYILLLLVISILTGHRCFSLDTKTFIGYLIFMNNIIVIFTFMFAMLKSIYMKLSYGKEARYLMTLLEEMGDLKQGRPHWESSLKAFTYYLCLLLTVCVLWAPYCLVKYRMLSYQTSYPWDQDNLKGMMFAFQISFMTAIYTSLIHSALDSIISVSCGIMIGHLTVLADLLRSIGRPGNPDRAVLVSAVELHVNLIRASNKMNYCFNLLFAFQAVYTILHACVLIFAFVKSDDVIAAICNTMPMLIASYAQLFMYCYYGQKLTSKFDELTFAAYDNRWYRCSLEVQKGLLMLTRTSKKQIALRGIGEAMASFASYLSCIQESISFYLFLKTMTAGESKKPEK